MKKHYVRVNGDAVSHVLTTWGVGDQSVFELVYKTKPYDHYFIKDGYTYDIDRVNKIVTASPKYNEITLSDAKKVFRNRLLKFYEHDIESCKTIAIENGAVILSNVDTITTIKMFLDFIKDDIEKTVTVKASNGYFDFDSRQLVITYNKIANAMDLHNKIEKRISELANKCNSIDELIDVEKSTIENGA